jgi:hypothetical protein
MSLEDLRGALAKLSRTARGRALASALLGSIFMGAFGALLIIAARHPMVQRGEAFFVFRGGEIFFAIVAGYWFLQVVLGIRRAPGKSLTEGEPQACAAFYRSALERQRNSHRRSAVWLPLVVSACFLVGGLLAPPFRVILIAIWVLSVPFYIYFSLQHARVCQHELDKLNASFGQSSRP